jgi:hypothetical protein
MSSISGVQEIYLGIQARVFEAVAGDGALIGALHGLARQFGTEPESFAEALDGLARAGWVRAESDPEGTITIRLA